MNVSHKCPEMRGKRRPERRKFQESSEVSSEVRFSLLIQQLFKVLLNTIREDLKSLFSIIVHHFSLGGG